MRFGLLVLLILLSSCTQPQTGLGTFDITLRFNGSFSTSQKTAIQAAVTGWKRVISLGLATDNNLSFAANQCAKGFPAFSGSISSVLVDVGVASLGGSTLAESGSCLVDTNFYLTRYGTMVFDSAQLAILEKNGMLTTTALHELGHVLGFGTLWETHRNLIVGGGSSCGTNPVYVGVNAEREWHSLGGTGDVPLENTGGSGTCDGHWRESIFGNELMTGYLDSGKDPLSRLTVAAMADLGYGVNYAAADSFVWPASIQSVPTGTKLESKLYKPQGTLP